MAQQVIPHAVLSEDLRLVSRALIWQLPTTCNSISWRSTLSSGLHGHLSAHGAYIEKQAWIQK